MAKLSDILQLVCDKIELEPCGSQNGFAPSWRDYLIVSPLWNFKKSWVYCGHATTLTSIKHTSVCNQASNAKQFRRSHGRVAQTVERP